MTIFNVEIMNNTVGMRMQALSFAGLSPCFWLEYVFSFCTGFRLVRKKSKKEKLLPQAFCYGGCVVMGGARLII
jgi:hypothetical protein